MTPPNGENGRAIWVFIGRSVLGVVSILGLVYFGIMIGESNRQIHENAETIRNIQAVMAIEMNRSISTDAELKTQVREIIVRLDEVIRQHARMRP